MQLFIMRHGEAELDAVSDQQRKLTQYGRSEVLDMANTLKDVVFDLIIVSTYIRAQETAKLVIEANSLNAKVDICELFIPAGSAKTVHDYLDGVFAEANYQNVLIVSHMPLLCYLMAELTAGSDMPIFQTAGVAKLTYQIDKALGQFDEMLCPFNICDI